MEKVFFGALFFLLNHSCSSAPEPKEGQQAKALYQQAQQLAQDGRYLMALEKLGKIRSQYPYSIYVSKAELLQGDVLFEQENFAEAATAYTLFREFRPKHPRADYVLWKISDSYFRQLPSGHDRDLSLVEEVLRYSEELVAQHPGSEFVPQAQKNMAQAQALVREQERYVANFYFKTGRYGSARYRYRDLITRPGHGAREVDLFIKRAMLASLRLKERDNCLEDYENYSPLASEQAQQEVAQVKQQCMRIPDEKS